MFIHRVNSNIRCFYFFSLELGRTFKISSQ
uniref:Uncharacterized protein n=1 Tax=Arundo donax TaxID=35708 RepID=A0A0A8Z5D5_ARUDO